MSPPDLGAAIARHIRSSGPISIALFMAMALHHPGGGYYVGRRPIGRAGDFITAPEISQIFGELTGLCCADLWRRLGRPDPVIVAELGPGRGTLMRDFLRAAAGVADFRRALRLHLVEASPLLRAEQERSLAAARPRFAADVATLPEGPLLLVANEFLDALPIRQLVRGNAHWAERLVGLDGEGGLAFVQGPESSALDLLVPEPLREMPPGAIVEIRPAASALAAALADRLVRDPGAALFFDYGTFPSAAGSTLAALRGHRAVGVFDRPGTADLSAHVDFAVFAAAARAGGATVHGPVPQAAWLGALGAEARLAALSRAATASQRALLASGLRRLLDPAGMGNLFKAIALSSPGLPAPEGFAAAAPGESG